MSYELPESTWPIDGGDRSAQSHLDHLKSVVSAINTGWWFQNRVWSEDATGALSYPPVNDDSLLVEATASPSMQVKVLLGAGFLEGVPFRKTADTTIAALVAPTVNPRIDTIGINPETGAVVIYTGAEHASPTAPSVAAGIFKAGEVYLRVGATEIYDTEQSTGGYIQNLRALFSLPGEEPHTSGLTVSGGAFIHDGSSGDITLPADGLSIEFDFAGEVNIDATDAAGHLIFRTGGNTDRLTLGVPAEPIILHGSAGDLYLTPDGETLYCEGPNVFTIEQRSGDGLALETGLTRRYLLDDDGKHDFIGSSGTLTVSATGRSMVTDGNGGFNFDCSNANGYWSFRPGGGTDSMLQVAGDGVIIFWEVGTNAFYFQGDGDTLVNDGANQFVINQTGATDGLMLQTASENRYQINEAGRHDIWGDAYFANDVYIAGTLYIGGVAFTGDGGGDSTGYATITLPGTVFEPASSGGSGGPGVEEFGSNVLLFQSFPDADDGYCMAPNVLMPLNFNASQTVYVRVRWSANTTSANQVRFLAYTAPQGEGDAANQALNTAATILDANGTTANQMRVSEWTALPVAGIAAGDAFALRLDRTPTHGDDTLSVDVRVHSVDIRYTRGSTL